MLSLKSAVIEKSPNADIQSSLINSLFISFKSLIVFTSSILSRYGFIGAIPALFLDSVSAILLYKSAIFCSFVPFSCDWFMIFASKSFIRSVFVSSKLYALPAINLPGFISKLFSASLLTVA